jgi:hypothetical protein
MLNDCPVTIKVVAHYPLAKSGNFGTFHVLWIEAPLELKGCQYCLKKNNAIWTEFPSKQGPDPKTKENIRYPTFNLPGMSEKMKELYHKINDAFIKYAKAQHIEYTKPFPGTPRYNKKKFKKPYNSKPVYQHRTGNFKPNQFMDPPKPSGWSRTNGNGPS